MRESKFTGKFIYQTLKKAYEELNDLAQSCEMVSEELGQHSKAFEILNNAYRVKQEEIKQLEEQLYIK